MHRPRPRLVSLANDHRQAHEVAALAGWGGCINDNGQAVEAVLAADEHIAQTELALAYLTAHRLLLTDNLGADLWLSPVLRAYLYERQPAPARPAARRHRRRRQRPRRPHRAGCAGPRCPRRHSDG